MMNRKLLYIRWHDAAGCGPNWEHIFDLYDRPLIDFVIDSVGFVLQETDTVIHIAPHLNTVRDGQYCGDMQIPKSAIIDIWEIES